MKPDDGAGGLDTFVYDNIGDACAEYDARAAAGRNPVLQEWVDGEPLSLSLICGAHGVELVSINRQLIGLSDTAAPGRTSTWSNSAAWKSTRSTGKACKDWR